MSTVSSVLRRAPHQLMFWLIIAVFAVGALRAFFPIKGFDEVRTGEVPLEVAGGDDGLWVLNYADHTVSLVRTSDKEVLLTTEVGADVAPALSANDDGAWLILDAGTTIGRVDANGEIVDRFDVSETVDGIAQDLAAGPDFVWVTTGEGEQMVRIDTATGEMGDVIEVGEIVVQPQVLGDSLWVYESDGITEYDNTTGEQLNKLEIVNHRVHDFYATEDSIWFLADVDNFDETGLVVRLDPETGEESQVRISKSTPSHITVGDDQVFVTGTGGFLFEVSTDTDRPPAILAGEQVTVSTKDLRGVTVLDDIVWVADGTNGIVHQPITGVEGGDITTDTEPSVG
jgi:hypothetical protein